MKIKKFDYYVCDFETTVYPGQVNTEVWASACVEFFTEDVQIFHSIGEQFDFLKNLKSNVCVYFHNLKFDGSFWLSYLLVDLQLKQAYTQLNEAGTEFEFLKEKDMPNNSFKYAISDRGQWYSITIKINNKFIEIRDSLKLLPFSVKKIGKSFGTKHKKLEMDYKGFRYAGCEITEDEQEYIRNDVLVIKEALEIMYTNGHDKLTIGSCCLAEYKKLVGDDDFKMMFPSLTEYFLDDKKYKYLNADKYIRRSYKGGWCYLVKGKENQVFHNGTTADVNSLYPSMMSSESKNPYPIGNPKFWKGDYLPNEILKNDSLYYFVRIKTKFYLKPGYLPFIQIKGNFLYKGTEALESSDIYDKATDQYYDKYYNTAGELIDTAVELTLTMTDFILLKEHYNLVDFRILDGCYFYTAVGIFDDYIEKYKKIKLESEGALRELAKLFLNNLYGKMASSTDSSFKVAYVNEKKIVSFISVSANDKSPGFIAVGSAITSYARNFTIRVAQQNYHGKDKPGFIYADTDSIHCDISPQEVKGIVAHDKNFCCWKLESCWDDATFTRQKTYIEHITQEDLKTVEPYYSVKCAGMPQRCKDLFIQSFEDTPNLEDYTQEEQTFLSTRRTIADFKLGLIVPGKLMPKRIRGGILLCDSTYEMR